MLGSTERLSRLPVYYFPGSCRATIIIICQFSAVVKSVGTSLRSELRLAPHTPSPGWHTTLSTMKMSYGNWFVREVRLPHMPL